MPEAGQNAKRAVLGFRASPNKRRWADCITVALLASLQMYIHWHCLQLSNVGHLPCLQILFSCSNPSRVLSLSRIRPAAMTGENETRKQGGWQPNRNRPDRLRRLISRLYYGGGYLLFICYWACYFLKTAQKLPVIYLLFACYLRELFRRQNGRKPFPIKDQRATQAEDDPVIFPVLTWRPAAIPGFFICFLSVSR